jgi:hypothetical protein
MKNKFIKLKEGKRKMPNKEFKGRKPDLKAKFPLLLGFTK